MKVRELTRQASQAMHHIAVDATKPHHGVAYRPFRGGWEEKPVFCEIIFPICEMRGGMKCKNQPGIFSRDLTKSAPRMRRSQEI